MSDTAPARVKKVRKSALTLVDGTKGNDAPVRAIVLGVNKQVSQFANEEMETSRQLPQDDPWATLVKDGLAIAPPIDPLLLSMLPENNSELNQVVEAMEVNIEGFGQRYIHKNIPEKLLKQPLMIKRIAAEKLLLTNFFNNCCIDSAPTFKALRRMTRRDLETTGNAWWEIIQDSKGQIRGMEWAPSFSMRVTPLEKEAVKVKIPRVEITATGLPKLVHVTRYVRFRKYVQIREGKKVYFKELGDPRTMDWRDGTYKDDIAVKHQANPMFHFAIKVARTPYGLPRFIGNLFSIFGSRAAEEINFTTLKNNNIPSMVLMISGGGMLTEGTIKRIEEFVESNIQGQSNYSKFLILEAEPIEEGALPGQADNIKIQIQELTQSQIQDAMFQDYDKNNAEKVRSSYRMPPIFVGRSQDYTRATAETSKRLADEQVFSPEREAFDDIMNTQILPRLGIVLHNFKTNSPNVTENTDLIKMLAAAEKTGGLTPQIARDVMSDVLNEDLGKVTAIDAEVPFTIQVAEAAKNTAPVNQGTVAPIKSMDGGAVIESLLTLRTDIQKALQAKEGIE
jgi:PBSX family phage portal protein